MRSVSVKRSLVCVGGSVPVPWGSDGAGPLTLGCLAAVELDLFLKGNTGLSLPMLWKDTLSSIDHARKTLCTRVRNNVSDLKECTGWYHRRDC